MKKNIMKLDKTLLGITFVFFIFGLIMILSASSMESYMRFGRSPYYYFLRQAIFLCIGTIIYFIVINIPTKFYKKISYPLLIISLIALSALLIYGYSANSAKSWFKIGPLSIQPSEFTKIFLIIFFAKYYDKNKDNLTDWKKLLFPFLPCLIIFIIVCLQPDLGTGIIIIALSTFIFFAVPFSKGKKNLLTLILFTFIALGIIILIMTKASFLQDYQKQRFNFLDPCERYQEESGYQLCNSLIAFANGGLDGQGIGKSTQKYLYLPESYTDFIFPVIVEEWGLIVGIIIIITYLFLLLKIYRIALSATDLFNSLLVYGICIYIFLHIAINLIGVMGLGPLTGVPLPFLTYGGSYTLSLFIALALVQRVAIETNKTKKQRLIKKN